MEELIESSKSGNENSFVELLLLIKSDLYRIAKTRLDNDDDINDAIQETMIKSYSSLKKLKDNKTFKSWIFKILINECNQIYKKKSRKIKLMNKIETDKLLSNNIDSIVSSNSKIDFDMLIRELDYEERIIITLFYNNRYTCDEISKIIKLNVNTIKSKLNRAKEKLKKSYKGGVLGE